MSCGMLHTCAHAVTRPTRLVDGHGNEARAGRGEVWDHRTRHQQGDMHARAGAGPFTWAVTVGPSSLSQRVKGCSAGFFRVMRLLKNIRVFGVSGFFDALMGMRKPDA